MADSTGKTGLGVTLEIGDGGGTEVFVAVANVTGIRRSGRTSEEVDFTHLQSTSGYREFRQGFKDGGTLELDLHFDPTHATIIGANGLYALFLSGRVFNWRLNYTGAGWTKREVGKGFVQNPGDITISGSDPIAGTATIRVTGSTTIENAS